jgi:RNA polymerase sigma factor (sigma-70 family)
MTTSTLNQTPLQKIINGCHQEAQESYNQEAGYCFELFCRAFEKQEELAWNAIQNQYYRLVLKWLQAVNTQSLLSEEIDELVQDTFVKFWRSLSRQTKSIRQHFQHVGAILKYLKQCAVTAFLDYKRRHQKALKLEQHLTDISIENSTSNESILDHVAHTEQIERIQHWIKQDLTDPLEKLVLQMSYEQGLKPATIVAHHPQKFKDAREVYRIRERVLRRAKRALAN